MESPAPAPPSLDLLYIPHRFTWGSRIFWKPNNKAAKKSPNGDLSQSYIPLLAQLLDAGMSEYSHMGKMAARAIENHLESTVETGAEVRVLAFSTGVWKLTHLVLPRG